MFYNIGAKQATTTSQSQKEDASRAQKFLDSMSRKSTDVPTDFLNTIEEETRTRTPEVLNGKSEETGGNASIGKILARKYPFNRFRIIFSRITVTV